jgi:hypothetical protein
MILIYIGNLIIFIFINIIYYYLHVLAELYADREREQKREFLKMLEVEKIRILKRLLLQKTEHEIKVQRLKNP